MAISIFELFKIGIGPSSSHTVGPMRAAMMFAEDLVKKRKLAKSTRVQVDLYGSLGATGKGHGSDIAVMLGLEGEAPDLIDPDIIPDRIAFIRKSRELSLAKKKRLEFDPQKDIVFHRRESLPFHPNGLRICAYGDDSHEILSHIYYSVGGGFVIDESDANNTRIIADTTRLPHHFSTGDELLQVSEKHGLSISAIMMANEKVWRNEAQIRSAILKIWEAMQECVKRGCHHQGEDFLPGGLKVKRRAHDLYQKLAGAGEASLRDPLTTLDWVNLYALAVNEENAAGGRVVTAPTNGAAGIIPAVLHYYHRFIHGANEDGVVRFLLTAAAIGILYKENASISGAEVGCQGEVGVACSMAAGALCEVLGGNARQVENAAEIAMEHNLGLTCDPIGGLVQIPCIERNAMASIKAINAARMALRGDGQHFVSLDKVIKTMRDTGRDMKEMYKETSRGGLAVNVIEC